MGAESEQHDRAKPHSAWDIRTAMDNERTRRDPTPFVGLPNDLAFFGVVAHSSAPQSFTLVNRAPGWNNVRLAIVGLDAAAFVVDAQPEIAILERGRADQSPKVQVRCVPHKEGALEAVLLINHDFGQQHVLLRGTAVEGDGVTTPRSGGIPGIAKLPDAAAGDDPKFALRQAARHAAELSDRYNAVMPMMDGALKSINENATTAGRQAMSSRHPVLFIMLVMSCSDTKKPNPAVRSDDSIGPHVAPKASADVRDHLYGAPTTPAAVFPDMIFIAKTHAAAAFYLDKREVTVQAYEDCVKVGVCQPSSTADSCAGDANNRKHERMTHPVNCITAADAFQYCRYRNKRLPSDDEFAAASAVDEKSFPWGASPPTCDRAVLAGCGTTGTAEGGSRPGGRTRGGIDDLMGNVAEVIGSGPQLQANSFLLSVEASTHLVEVFGGSYATPLDENFLLRGHSEGKNLPSPEIGVRCASSLPGQPQIATRATQD